MPSQPVVHMDETGWSQGGKRRWMWTALTRAVAVFAIRASRGAKQGSFGAHSEQGNRFVESLLTVSSTCRLQGRDVLGYLAGALLDDGAYS